MYGRVQKRSNIVQMIDTTTRGTSWSYAIGIKISLNIEVGTTPQKSVTLCIVLRSTVIIGG